MTESLRRGNRAHSSQPKVLRSEFQEFTRNLRQALAGVIISELPPHSFARPLLC
jgi:hypothetical protein